MGRVRGRGKKVNEEGPGGSKGKERVGGMKISTSPFCTPLHLAFSGLNKKKKKIERLHYTNTFIFAEPVNWLGRNCRLYK